MAILTNTTKPYLAALAVLALGAAGFVAYRQFLVPSPDEIERTKQRQTLAQRMQPGQFTDPVSGNVMPWRLFVPPGADGARRLPVVLALHSGGGRGDDNLRQLDDTVDYLLSDALQGIEPTFVVAPQAATRSHWVDYPSFDPPFTNFDQGQIPQSENLKTAIRLLRDVIQNYNVDPERIYVTGISMGGEGAWDALTYYPDLFAAALVLNGAGDPRAMERVRHIPIRFFHGSADTITPVANSRELDAALRAAGAMARYEELAGAGHNIRDLVYGRGHLAWLLMQSRQE